jgi:hypothetical protein
MKCLDDPREQMINLSKIERLASYVLGFDRGHAVSLPSTKVDGPGFSGEEAAASAASAAFRL